MNWIDRLSQVLRPLEQFAARHPRALTGTLLGLIGSFGVTAFGIAPLVPNASDLPQRTVQEALPVLPLEEQLAELAQHSIGLRRHDSTRSGDTADSLLSRLGAFDSRFAAHLRSDPTAQLLLKGRAGKRVELTADANGKVQKLVARYAASSPELAQTHFSRLVVERLADGELSSRLEMGRLETSVRLASGQIESSLFAATDEAGLPDSVGSQLAEMFSGEIDFHRELRKGDRFTLVFEGLSADGEPVSWGAGAGRVLAAEFVNAGRSHQAVWFQDPQSGKASFYDFEGQNKRRAFLASPMEFSRVTSGFAMRFHPIHNTWRRHNGVDYGAPHGAPVRSVGDGIVEFAGWQNGFGNVVHLRHSGDRTTVYAHLSKIDVRKGQRVDQGQRVGAVGATGWATGPHLHFEFRVGGQHKDPRVLAKASESTPLPAHARAPFKVQVAEARGQLKVAATLGQGVTGAD
ncbi:murein DD-endopeptidase MepM/ murein hydrolase activator NlpD [Inhella inkyongensis]|uniref:Murein DD-endopeptidase MepM/ murein hydrolase activator NlpD n=1 Tax=Inhella inkyongensis TaxID=392593 RepID=A0A840S6N7_9BURK|nr:peptidoglycan DD-metalloendopeptidase family protein [Inhella inkyongensis]MBB5204656.1 murein DD-endopeptidase MepM/ murein hydrolase activator NlpD [Inhella inkyongensis]